MTNGNIQQLSIVKSTNYLRSSFCKFYGLQPNILASLVCQHIIQFDRNFFKEVEFFRPRIPPAPR